MSKTEDLKLPASTLKAIAITTCVVALLSLGAVWAYHIARAGSGTIVLPGGVTYLGPTNEQKTQTAPLRFTAPPTTRWAVYEGTVYPYSFSYPSSLTLVAFPNDPTDAVAISWGNISPQENILINVENLEASTKTETFMKKSKREYIAFWWQQYDGLTGVSQITEFTNAQGLRGWRAKFINTAGATPNDDVFFELPGRSELVIHLANGVLDPSIFDRIVDSVAWDTP